VADAILPKKIQRISNLEEFESCFDTASHLFDGVAKEYVLAKIMSTANKKKIPVSNSYMTKYYRESKTKAYTSIVRKLFSEQKKINKLAVKVGSDALFDFSSLKLTNIDKIIEDNSGKLIVFDFWASWCIPCLEEIPYENKLQEYFSDKEVVFINVSLDNEMRNWKNAIRANNIVSKNNYLFVNFNESDFIKKYGIELIPRYMLFGKDGKLENDSLPRPSDQAFKYLIEKLLLQ
jgi:thiol-disulfide isomerase/thioredoxin